MRTRRSISIARCARLAPASLAVAQDASAIWSPTVKAGLSEVIGSWKIMAIAVAAKVAQRAGGSVSEIDALEQHLAAGDAAGRLRHEAHDRERGDALAAAGLADDAERAARAER